MWVVLSGVTKTAWDVMFGATKTAWDVMSGATKTAWDVMSGATITAWDVLSGMAKLCGMFCPGCQKMAWDVLSRDVLSGSLSIHPFKLFLHFKYGRFIVKTYTYLFVLQIRPTGNSYFPFQKRWRTDKHKLL